MTALLEAEAAAPTATGRSPARTGRGPWIAAAAAALGLHALLLGGALAGLPPVARVVLSGAAVLLGPGFAFLRLGLVPPGGLLPGAGWALGFGVAWNAVLVLVLEWAGVSFLALELWALPAHGALWIVALAAGRPAAPPAEPLGRGPRLAILLAGLAALWVAVRVGPIMTLQSDAPDHIGTVRRMLASGEPFPEDAFFRDAGRAGADPRKGVWHPQAALVTKLADADPLDAWRWLPAVLAPLYVLGAAVFGRIAAGPAGAAIAAWALLLTWGGSLAVSPLRQAVFSSRLADALALAALAAAVGDLVRPAARLRVAAALLGFAAVTSHLFAVVQIAVPLAALGGLLAIRDRGVSPPVRRLLGTAAVMAAAALPFLVWRAAAAYAPGNVIHTEPQGLLELGGGWRVTSPGALWSSLGWTWVLFPLAWVPLWRARRDPVALFLLGASLAAALLAYNPLAVAVLEPRIGYLLMRLTWLVPVAVFLAWALPRLWAAARSGPRRRAAAAALAAVGLTLLPAVRDAAAVAADPAALSFESEQGRIRWPDALEWMRTDLPDSAVVLSDPVTSYSIPMVAGRYVVTVIDQHSSPNDPRGVERLLDTRDALDPHGGWDRVREVVARHRVSAIAVNGRFASAPRTGYWGPRPEAFAATRARFDRHPAVFRPAFDRGDFVVYIVDRRALDTLSGPPPPRPYVARWQPGGSGPGRRLGEGVPLLHRLRLDPSRAMPGDTITAVAEWRAPAPLAPGSWTVVVRLDAPLPGGLDPPRWLEKPVRKAVERLRGEKYRLRADHLPTGGSYGVDLWRPDEIVRDSFRIAIPGNAAPGAYVAQIRMMRLPHFPNHHVRDYFLDDDLFSGIPAGRLRIGPGPPVEDADVRH